MMDFQVVVLAGGFSKNLVPLVSKVTSFFSIQFLFDENWISCREIDVNFGDMRRRCRKHFCQLQTGQLFCMFWNCLSKTT